MIMPEDILNLLYQFIIGPLLLLFEFIFNISYNLISIPWICIVILSLIVNILVLPLYKRADELQTEADKAENAVKNMSMHIKKSFKGDERVMILQTYYGHMKNSPYHYSPLNSLKSSISLILQIPFFIAAYSMLSELSVLKGSSMGPISDLSMPDSLFHIGPFPVNVLPILMTAINILSSFVFSSGKGMKDKLQLYITAFVFLILLYNSPSGLVFYWTCNNIFSLIKNILTIRKQSTSKKKVGVKSPHSRLIFILSGIYHSVLLGIYIPTTLVKSSTPEFIDMYNMINPSYYILWSLALSAGFFILWFGIFYYLSSENAKEIWSIASVILAFLFTVNYFLFGRDFGVMSSALYYQNADMGSIMATVNGILIILAVSICGVLMHRFIWKHTQYIMGVLLVSVLFLSVLNIIKINSTFKKLDYVYDQYGYAEINLSNNKQNVIVIMLDRAPGFFVPYCFNEFPELEQRFDGFTFYENTLSFGAHTNIASPALFGGYEYTPEKLSQRENELLSDKHNEALRIMPVLFSENGFDVTVCDPSYAGYNEIPDLSIYNEYPNIQSYITLGRYDEYADDEYEENSSSWKRNFFCYSLFKVVSPFMQELLYDDGHYNLPDFYNNHRFVPICSESGSRSLGLGTAILRGYSAMANLNNMTNISETSEGGFAMFVAYGAHDPAILSEPDYTPQFYVDNTIYDEEHRDRFDGLVNMDGFWQLSNYHVNMASYLLLADWFDYLREQGVYDNTRIIIVADHGCDPHVVPGLFTDDFDIENYNPVLMVKDFDSHGFNISDEFMTNADTPVLALNGIVDNPINPFTGNPITDQDKYDQPILISDSHQFDIEYNNGTTFLPGPWYEVNGNVLDPDSWEYAGEW